MDDPSTNSPSLINSLTTSIAVFASLVLSFLLLLQTDRIRRLVLSPNRLRRVRRDDQRHAIEREIANRISGIRRSVNGGGEYEADAERCITDVVWEDEEVDELVTEILKNGAFGGCADSNDDGDHGGGENDEKIRLGVSTPTIVGISLDLSQKNGGKSQEWFIYLAYPQLHPSTNQISYGRRVQTPLLNFTIKLATALRSAQTHTPIDKESSHIMNDCGSKLCFVADASSGLGTNILASFFQNHPTPIVLVEEPAWMTTLAYLIQTKAFASYTRDIVASVIYGLCRLQVSDARQRYASSTNGSSAATAKTSDKWESVLVTLPGQSCTDILLPLLYQSFPRSHFIFCYDTCIRTVERGISLPTLTDNVGSNSKRVASMPQNISAAVPISLSKKGDVQGFEERLAEISASEAGVVEAWVTSVASFLLLESQLDQEREEEEQKGTKGGITSKTPPSLSAIDVGTLVKKTSVKLSHCEKEETELWKTIALVTNSNQTNSGYRTLSQTALDFEGKAMISIKTLTPENYRAIDRCAAIHDDIRLDRFKRFL